MNNDLQSRLIRTTKNLTTGDSNLISQDLIQHLSNNGYTFAAEKRFSVANDALVTIQVEATTKPVTLVFGAELEALTYVDSYIGATLTTPTTLTPFNYKPSSTEVATAIVKTATAFTGGTKRGESQAGAGNPGQSIGGSSRSTPTTIVPGEKVSLVLTNKSGTTKSISLGAYFSEVSKQ